MPTVFITGAGRGIGRATALAFANYLLEGVPPRAGIAEGRADVVACDVEGTAMTTDAFAHWLQRTRESARSVALLIGGAFGLSDGVRARARSRLSLAPWTLPHELARLVLAEQLYRAGTIVRGEPYHK